MQLQMPKAEQTKFLPVTGPVYRSSLSASIYKGARHAKMILHEFFEERIDSLRHSLLKVWTSFFISAFTAR